MRILALALLGATAIGVGASAQGTKNTKTKVVLPKLNPHKDPLDWVLVKWERAMKKVNSLIVDINRTNVDKVFKSKAVFKGKAKFLKTRTVSLASLELYKVGQPKIFEKFIITGTFLYQFDPTAKKIWVHAMPKQKNGQIADNNLVSLLFGMGAARAKLRYHLKYIPPPKKDKWYYYVEIKPKSKADKADFKRARLVLLRSNFMPRQLWFESPNGNEITWDLPKVQSPAPKLTVLEFQRPAVPKGWQMQMQRMKISSRPRIIRNQK